MNILITSSAPMPYGMALTNRIIAFAKGFIKLGHPCEILILHPTKKSKYTDNKDIKASFEGLRFQYNSKSTIIPKHSFKKIFIYLQSVASLYDLINKKNKEKKIDFIFSFHSYSIFLFTVLIVSKKLKIPVIHERNEYPFIGIKSFLKKLDYFFYKNYLIHKFNGLILISHELKYYFQDKLGIKQSLLVVPIIVEPERFACEQNVADESYIAYCGTMWGDKDGVLILLESFSKVCKHISGVKLYLIGDISNKDEYQRLLRKIDKLNLKQRVKFSGYLIREKMSEYLCNAKLLVLSRPDNLQAKAGFPTKLGEYLATGKPVLITRVGDIPKYIKDGQNGFLAEPGSADSFAEKIRWIFQNYEVANHVGIEGKKLTKTHFNYIYQSKRVINFVKEIIL